MVWEAYKLIPRSKQEQVISEMNKMSNKLFTYFDKRFKDTSESMKYWKCARNLDPAFDGQPKRIREAFGNIKFGPSFYQNQSQSYRKLQREYTHFIEIFVDLYKETEVENGEFSGITFNEFSQKDYQQNHQLLIAKYKIDGDILFFYKNSGYELLDILAIKALDNPNCNVDDERAMSQLTWITGSKLSGAMSGATMITRLMGCWNDDLFRDY